MTAPSERVAAAAPQSDVDVATWRGVAAEGSDDVSAATGVRLRERSRRLLRSLLRPHRRLFGYAVALLLVQNLAGLAGPYLVSVGIDAGIPPIVREGDASLLVTVVILFGLAAAVEYAAKRGFLVASGRIGQAVLLDLRRRVYDHFQRLSVAFHERYTSGRVISRLTSDVDAMGELVDGGLDDLVIAGLNVVSIGAVLLILDWRLALIVLASFPPLWWLSTWYRRRSAVGYRRTRETIALVIVHFVESLGGIRAVQAFRREPRNTALFEVISDDHRRATRYTNRLVALFSPGIQLIGNLTTALVLTVGGWFAVGGSVRVGVLAAFLLYLRRFFEPMQELSMFYNALQSATAGLEKLSGVLEEEPGVPEPAVPTPLPAVAGAVRFQGVRFAYRA
ncbi:MAG TPA: ABC transporter ATP-binding protein, partial [Cryptosporangiaceae bacterium]|nr:ABC transporter ATP-binding protein [Cryptosporangiaceae bacterium]